MGEVCNSPKICVDCISNQLSWWIYAQEVTSVGYRKAPGKKKIEIKTENQYEEDVQAVNTLHWILLLLDFETEKRSKSCFHVKLAFFSTQDSLDFTHSLYSWLQCTAARCWQWKVWLVLGGSSPNWTFKSLPPTFYWFFTRWMNETNRKGLGNVPSGAAGQ